MISVFPSVGTEYFMLQGNLPQNRNNILSLKEGSYNYFFVLLRLNKSNL